MKSAFLLCTLSLFSVIGVAQDSTNAYHISYNLGVWAAEVQPYGISHLLGVTQTRMGRGLGLKFGLAYLRNGAMKYGRDHYHKITVTDNSTNEIIEYVRAQGHDIDLSAGLFWTLKTGKLKLSIGPDLLLGRRHWETVMGPDPDVPWEVYEYYKIGLGLSGRALLPVSQRLAVELNWMPSYTYFSPNDKETELPSEVPWRWPREQTVLRPDLLTLGVRFSL